MKMNELHLFLFIRNKEEPLPQVSVFQKSLLFASDMNKQGPYFI
jgi:hypothetical protein